MMKRTFKSASDKIGSVRSISKVRPHEWVGYSCVVISDIKVEEEDCSFE